MKKTKTYFETPEMEKLSGIIVDCVRTLEADGVTIDAAKQDDLTRRVIEIASKGISDPDEIRELVLANMAS
jgi:hypothetical protein